jgi:GDP-L-fucose synthase
VAAPAGFGGRIEYDASRPEATPRKLLDSTRLAQLGWRAKIGLAEGVAATYRDFEAGMLAAAQPGETHFGAIRQ